MSEKRELSDEALDLVAGGRSIDSCFSEISTIISTSGPSVAGPGAGAGAGPCDSVPTIEGGDRISTRVPMLGADIYMQLRNAGTLEQFERDFDEYSRRLAEWKRKYASDGYLIQDAATSGEPVPIPPNPYDYL